MILPGYTLTEMIHEGAETLVYRGVRDSDGASIVAKLFKSEHPRPRELAKLQHEYALLRSLDIPGVIKAYALEKYGNGLALIVQGIEAQPLSRRVTEGAMEVRAALTVALRLAEVLEALHERQIVHKDIKPHNVLYDPQSQRAYLIDFGIATRLSQETQAAAPSNALEGTLAYLSPEQTGRTNRVVDHRTDFYSLGVTLYEMLTGVLPFQSTDAMELVHHHIALPAVPPAQRRSEIPAQVSALVMKLLAKNPEERYQNARGLIADLKECLHQLEQHGTVAPFALGAHDTSSTLKFPQRLYGRQSQEAELLASLRRVQSGRPELVLVTGPAGIGKSSLVHDLEPEIMQRGGQLVSGKFDQRHRSLPFAAFTQAFRELCRRLLMQSAANLEQQRAALLQAVGVNGKLLTDLIPELELIIGAQPAVAPLDPTEAQHRFGGVVQSFVRVFCSAEHPLVMLLEDLQWADSASLWLLRLLLSDEERGYLQLVATYRSEEVDAAHPVFAALDGLRKQGRAVVEIAVGPLDLDSIRQYLCELLRHPISPELEALARQIEAKTHGNPFFLSQFLLTLHASKLLRRDPDSGEWTWDAAAIEAAPITDNVAEFMGRQIGRLAPQTQQLLAAAACIGYHFDLETLAAVADSTVPATHAALLPALTAGLVLPLAPEFSAHLLAESAPAAQPDAARAASFWPRARPQRSRTPRAPPPSVSSTTACSRPATFSSRRPSASTCTWRPAACCATGSRARRTRRSCLMRSTT